jgi:hypothetical protein
MPLIDYSDPPGGRFIAKHVFGVPGRAHFVPVEEQEALDQWGDRALGVSPEQVGSLDESSDRGFVAESRVSALMVVVPEPAVKGGRAL